MDILNRPATRGGGKRPTALPRNFHRHMYLLGAATSYIILSPPKIRILANFRIRIGFGYLSLKKLDQDRSRIFV